MYNAQVPGNSTVQWSGSQVMPTGATLQAQASSAGITINGSGGKPHDYGLSGSVHQRDCHFYD